MAFKMKPGRSPFAQTGRGIPTPFMQTNINTGEDLSAQARAKAEAEAKAKLTALGENKGTSKDVRNVEATATVTKEGKKVEKFASTPEEIKKWKAASAENKAKYQKQSATETVKLSDVGSDKPIIPTTPKEAPKSYGSWTKESVDQNFGGGTVTGYTDSQAAMDAGDKKLAYDRSRGNQIAAGSNPAGNVYKHQEVTAEEARLQNKYGDTASPYSDVWSDYGSRRGKDNPDSRIDTSPGSGEKRRQEWIKSTITKLDQKEADTKAKQAAVISKRKGVTPVAMQLKKKTKTLIKKTPAKMKKC